MDRLALELFEYLQKEQLKNKRLKRKIKRYKRIAKKKDRALDKACCELEEFDKWAASIEDGPVRNKEHWKEWCMRDEE